MCQLCDVSNNCCKIDGRNGYGTAYNLRNLHIKGTVPSHQ